MERKSVLQTAIRASRSWHVLAHKSFQLAPKPFLIGRIDYNPSVIWISPKSSTCLSGKLHCFVRTKITSPIAKSTSPGLLDTTFFARWTGYSFISYFDWRQLLQTYKKLLSKNKSRELASWFTCSVVITVWAVKIELYLTTLKRCIPPFTIPWRGASNEWPNHISLAFM